MTDAASSDSAPIPFQPAHAATFAAVWVFSFLILRIFAVSEYDWKTAFQVSTTLSVNDGVALLFGSLMAGHVLTGSLLVLVLPLILAAIIWRPRGHRTILKLLAGLSVLLVVALTLSFGSWWLPPAIAVVFGFIALTRRLAVGNRLRRATIFAATSVGWFTGVGLLLIAALVPTPWAPQEHIETTNGPVDGYVLSVDPGYLNVLTTQNKFVILLTSDVLSRD